MTDRYYPKRYVPDAGPLESTYNEMNLMITQPRSTYPPGYSGHEHGVKAKFGYSIPAPNALPNAPIDPADPLVNFRAGKAIDYRPLALRDIVLEKAASKSAAVQDTRAMTSAVLGTTQNAKTPLLEEDDFSASFIPQTTPYLIANGGCRGVTLEKAQPYIPAVPGVGTGFNSQMSAPAPVEEKKLLGTSATKDAYPVPVVERRGLEMMEYTVKCKLEN